MRLLTLFSISFLILAQPTDAYALGRIKDAWRSMTSSSKRKNPRKATEAKVPRGCTTGACTERAPFRNDPIRPIPKHGPARGAARVLASIYGACGAAVPLNAIEMDSVTRNKAYETRRATNSKQEAEDSGGWKVYVPGVKRKNWDVREISDSKSFNEAGPYGAALKRGKICRSHPGFNVAGTPKAFGNGAGGRMVNGEYNITQCGQPAYVNSLNPVTKAYRCDLAPNSKPTVTIDCAEFIGASFVASCTKFHKDQILDGRGFRFPGGRVGRELSTESLLSVGRSKSKRSCITNKVPISRGSSIRAGDVFIGSKRHAIMITRTGVDPLGIAKAKRRGNCDSISYKDMDFDMAQSASHSALGPINSSAKAYAHLLDKASKRNPYPLNKIKAMAIALCKSKSSGGPAQGFMNDSKFSLLRPKAGDPECSYSKDKCPKLAGDDCADDCGV